MRALVLTEAYDLQILDIADADPAVDEVLVQPMAVGICGSDVHGVRSRSPRRRPPLVMGHEFAGTVVASGGTNGAEFVGCTIAVNPQVPCRVCHLCRSGRENICQDRELVGGTRPGGLCELVPVPVTSLHRVPDGLSAERAALAEPLATCVHAINVVPDQQPALAVVIGGGAVGRLLADLLVRTDVAEVIVSEPDAGRRDLVHPQATAVTPDEMPQAVADITSGVGAPVVFDAVGTAATRRTSVDVLAPGGASVWLGMDTVDAPLDGFAMVTREQRVLGSFAYTNQEFATALRVLARSDVGSRDVPESVGLAQGGDLLGSLVQGQPAQLLKVMVDPQR